MKYQIILALIVLLACIIRIPLLSDYPNGFSADEAQQAYDAYSILKTGADEWGVFLPINPRGFGDYKPPLYTYLTVPFIGLLGLTKEAARLPAAILGVLTVIVIFHLTTLLFQDKKVGLSAALLLAISPWHIQASRSAFEGGIGVFLFLLGLVFFIKTGVLNHLIKLSNKYLIAAIISWGFAMYTYPSFRLFIVLFLSVIFFIYRKQFSLKNKIFTLLLTLVFILPIIVNFSSSSARLSDVGLLGKGNIKSYFENRNTSLPQYQKIFDNKFLYISGQFLDNYLSYYSPVYYFTGGRPDFSYLNFPGFPLFYSIEIIFLLISVYFILQRRIKRFLIILVWLLLATIPAAITLGSMHVNRGIIMLPVITLLAGYGFKILIDILARKLPVSFYMITTFFVILLTLNFFYFSYFYFVKLPSKPPSSLRYGYENIFNEVFKRENNFDYILIDKTTFSEPQIFVAFYGKLDPLAFQLASQDWLRYEAYGKNYVDQIDSYNLGKYLFEGVDWQNRDSKRINTLIVSSARSFPEDIRSEYDFKNSKGEIIYRIVSTNQNEK
jgi:4-amino-4-deoxy-L-arabinose transferase-like glycosyltransferase